MVTNVGHFADQTCTSIRADITRMQEIEYFLIENDWFEEVPVIGCPIVGVTDGFLGLGRWTKLATMAISDLIDVARIKTTEVTKVGFYITLPSNDRPGFDERIEQLLGLRIAQWCEWPQAEQQTSCYADGQAGLMRAIEHAQQHLLEGKIHLAIVGGVDSLVEPETLAFYYENKRLKTEDNPDGLIPGEASAFFALELERVAKARGTTPMATIGKAKTASDRNTIWGDKPPTSTGLSTAIREVLDSLEDQGENTGLVVCDLNGESYRNKEFANALPRTMNNFKTQWALWHPADCIGDSGAASSAVGVCLAARALQKGYARTNNVLVWGSSDDGLRGATYLRAVN